MLACSWKCRYRDRAYGRSSFVSNKQTLSEGGGDFWFDPNTICTMISDPTEELRYQYGVDQEWERNNVAVQGYNTISGCQCGREWKGGEMHIVDCGRDRTSRQSIARRAHTLYICKFYRRPTEKAKSGERSPRGIAFTACEVSSTHQQKGGVRRESIRVIELSCAPTGGTVYQGTTYHESPAVSHTQFK
jgi:hypothetical protein